MIQAMGLAVNWKMFIKIYTNNINYFILVICWYEMRLDIVMLILDVMLTYRLSTNCTIVRKYMTIQIMYVEDNDSIDVNVVDFQTALNS